MPNNSHLPRPFSVFSRRPMKPTHNSDTKPRMIPAHCVLLGLSPKRAMAPTSTRMGRTALIEPLMLNGKCFIEAKPRSHEMETTSDLMAMSMCPCIDNEHSGLPMSDITVSGLTIMVHSNTLTSSTANTLLRSSESFLNTSKNPRLIDDITASRIHIFFLKVQRYNKLVNYAINPSQ